MSVRDEKRPEGNSREGMADRKIFGGLLMAFALCIGGLVWPTTRVPLLALTGKDLPITVQLAAVIVSAFAFLALGYTIWQQSKMIDLQGQELRSQNELLKRSSEAHEATVEALQEQARLARSTFELQLRPHQPELRLHFTTWDKAEKRATLLLKNVNENEAWSVRFDLATVAFVSGPPNPLAPKNESTCKAYVLEADVRTPIALQVLWEDNFGNLWSQPFQLVKVESPAPGLDVETCGRPVLVDR